MVRRAVPPGLNSAVIFSALSACHLPRIRFCGRGAQDEKSAATKNPAAMLQIRRLRQNELPSAARINMLPCSKGLKSGMGPQCSLQAVHQGPEVNMTANRDIVPVS